MSLVRDGVFDPRVVEHALGYRVRHPQHPSFLPLTPAQGITEKNYALLSDRITKATLPEGLRSYGPHFAPCAIVHPDIDSCVWTQVAHFWEVFRWMLPIYGALHLIPPVLFRRKKFAQDPLRVLLRAALGTSRSSAFLGAFVVIYQCASPPSSCVVCARRDWCFLYRTAYFCGKHNLYEKLLALRGPDGGNTLLAALARRLPADILVSKASFFLGGLLSGLSLFVEEKRRREELAMYVLPKGMESAWVMARGRGWVLPLGRAGSPLLTAVGMGMVMVRGFLVFCCLGLRG